MNRFGKSFLKYKKGSRKIDENSLQQSGIWDNITLRLESKSINFSMTSISSEPSPILIDEIAKEIS